MNDARLADHQFTFTVCGRVLQHNAVKWTKKTNRHTTTEGRDWGWIEGAPGNICWSNDHGEDFNEGAAGTAVHVHNQWLEDQKPLSIMIIEAREVCASLKAEYVQVKEKFERAERAYGAAEQRLHELQEKAA